MGVIINHFPCVFFYISRARSWYLPPSLSRKGNLVRWHSNVDKGPLRCIFVYYRKIWSIVLQLRGRKDSYIPSFSLISINSSATGKGWWSHHLTELWAILSAYLPHPSEAVESPFRGASNGNHRLKTCHTLQWSYHTIWTVMSQMSYLS